MDIKIDPEFKNRIDPLLDEERISLEVNIVSNGCRDPLCLWDGFLIDGHHRYEICQRHNLPFKTVDIELPDRDHALLWIETNQLGRRNLTDSQRTCHAFEAQQLQAKINRSQRASEGGKTGGKNHPKNVSLEADVIPQANSIPRSRAQTAKKYKVSERAMREVAAIKKESPDTYDRIRKAEINIRQAKREIAATNREKAAEEAIAAMPTTICDRYKLFQADIKSGLPEIEDASIDAIVADPPYPQEYIPLIKDLVVLAERVLKDGGSLIVMIGQSYLPEVMAMLSSSTLTYRWTACYLTGGDSTDLIARKVGCGWKPLIILSKGKSLWNQFYDVIKSPDNDKTLHKWGQSEGGMNAIIEKLTRSGDHILDPFLGAGTTGVAALINNRSFTGCDIDEKQVAISAQRMGDII